MDVMNARIYKVTVPHCTYIVSESENTRDLLRIAREGIQFELTNQVLDLNLCPIDTLEECDEPDISPHGDNPEDWTIAEIFERREALENSVIKELDKYPTELLEMVLERRRNA
jgi:hypothetical protein